MTQYFFGIIIGWFLGSVIMRSYFIHADLMRNREEWQRAKYPITIAVSNPIDFEKGMVVNLKDFGVGSSRKMEIVSIEGNTLRLKEVKNAKS